MSRRNMAEETLGTSLEKLLEFTEKYTSQMEHLAKEKEAQLKEPSKELVLWTAIAGIQFYLDRNTEEGKRVFDLLTVGEPLILEREPENEHDRWAIRVRSKDGHDLGYVTRFKNETIARMMDYGHVFEARIESMEDANTQETI